MIINRNDNETLFLSLIKEGFFEIDENGNIWKTYDGRSENNKSKNIRRAEFGVTVKELSKIFNISKTNIRDIIKRRLWKHI